MEPPNFPNEPILKRSLDAGQNPTSDAPNSAEWKAHAVTELLKHHVLSDTFGEHQEYEVRTTLETLQGWRYQCRVFHHGKPVKRGFNVLDVDRTRRMNQKLVVTPSMRLAFATEAVEGHLALSAAVREYALLASLYAEPPSRHYRRWSIALIMLLVTALLITPWFFWDQGFLSRQPPQQREPAPVVRWTEDRVSYQSPSGQPFAFHLPRLEVLAAGVEGKVTLDPAADRPHWMTFDPDTMRISGVAPLFEQDQTYPLVFNANAGDGQASRLRVDVTITGVAGATGAPPRAVSEPGPAAPPAEEDDCLLRILKGEACE